MKVTEYNAILDEKRLPMLAEVGRHYVEGRKTELRGPKAVAEFIKDLIGNYAEERSVAIYLDNRLQVIGMSTIGVGSLTKCFIDQQSIFSKGLMLGASSVIIGHNHPSGYSEPSKEDIRVTKRVELAGLIVGINLLDHVIVGDEVFSLEENGYMGGGEIKRLMEAFI